MSPIDTYPIVCHKITLNPILLTDASPKGHSYGTLALKFQRSGFGRVRLPWKAKTMRCAACFAYARGCGLRLTGLLMVCYACSEQRS